jgi:hypothetical protein
MEDIKEGSYILYKGKISKILKVNNFIVRTEDKKYELAKKEDIEIIKTTDEIKKEVIDVLN